MPGKRRFTPTKSGKGTTQSRKNNSSGSFIPNARPSPIVLQPFFSLSLLFSLSKDTDVRVSDVAGRIAKQIDPDGKTLTWSGSATPVLGGIIIFKMQSIQLYGQRGSHIGFLCYDYSDFDQEVYNTFETLLDVGTDSSPPSLGYRFPNTLRQTPVYYSSNAASSKMELFKVLCKSPVSVIIKLSFRFWAGSSYSPVNILGPLERIADSTSESNEVLRELKALTEAIKSSQPTLLSKVKDGVSIATAAVTVLAGAELDRAECSHSHDSISSCFEAIEIKDLETK